MTRKWVLLGVCLFAMGAVAAKSPDFSGVWELNPQKSENIGMMAQAKMTVRAQQTESSLDLQMQVNFQGNVNESKIHYDLSGKPAANEYPMSGPSETVSKWEGDKLLTTWTSQGAVAGSKVVRRETRSLSSDGNAMRVETVRGDNPAVVMVFDKKQ